MRFTFLTKWESQFLITNLDNSSDPTASAQIGDEFICKAIEFTVPRTEQNINLFSGLDEILTDAISYSEQHSIKTNSEEMKSPIIEDSSQFLKNLGIKHVMMDTNEGTEFIRVNDDSITVGVAEGVIGLMGYACDLMAAPEN